VSRVLKEECGHQDLVANPRKTRLIYGQGRKTDKLDAEKLARLARVDPKLLSPLEHRGEASQAHLALIRSREVVVRSRAQFINPGYAERSSLLGLVCPSVLRRAFTKK
jgi:transposase